MKSLHNDKLCDSFNCIIKWAKLRELLNVIQVDQMEKNNT
jgi:hypothetical protein